MKYKRQLNFNSKAINTDDSYFGKSVSGRCRRSDRGLNKDTFFRRIFTKVHLESKSNKNCFNEEADYFGVNKKALILNTITIFLIEVLKISVGKFDKKEIRRLYAESKLGLRTFRAK